LIDGIKKDAKGMANCKKCGKKIRIPLDGCCRECYRKQEESNRTGDKLYGSVLATDVTPQYVDKFKGQYTIILDVTKGLRSFHLNNTVKAINIFAAKGWRCVNITATGSGVGCYALMERIVS
jgi:hypothetical protein